MASNIGPSKSKLSRLFCTHFSRRYLKTFQHFFFRFSEFFSKSLKAKARQVVHHTHRSEPPEPPELGNVSTESGAPAAMRRPLEADLEILRGISLKKSLRLSTFLEFFWSGCVFLVVWWEFCDAYSGVRWQDFRKIIERLRTQEDRSRHLAR